MKTQKIRSSNESVIKYVFDYGNAVAESVLYKYPTYNDRTVICCSTQSGCPIGCRFCGTGENFVRSLTADEIVSQVEYLFKDENIETEKVNKCQIMFMSMGEPMLNYKNLKKAIERLHILYPRFALLISTSGPDVGSTIWDDLTDLSIRIPNVGLQFSIHESTNEARNKLIPFKNKLTLEEIAHEGESWGYLTNRQPFFNYCAHDKNNSDQDAENLVNLFNPHLWQATISVICERDESVAASNNRQRQLALDFMNKLTAKGYSTRCFDPAGQDDTGSGCGQLWWVQKWMREHPGLARPTAGFNLPVIHTPK